MSCAEYKSQVIEAARSGKVAVVRAHLDTCYPCQVLFEEQSAVSEAIRKLPEDPAPLELEQILLDEFRATWPGKRTVMRWWIPAAAAVALLFGVLLYPKPKPVPGVVLTKPVEQPKAALTSPVRAGGAEAVAHVPAVRRPRQRPEQEELPPFVSIPYTTPLSPHERVQVMQVEMPVAELIAAGLPISTSDPGAQARADVIVGDDGRAHAVRVLSVFERSIEQ